jgi:hypothetical protein
MPGARRARGVIVFGLEGIRRDLTYAKTSTGKALKATLLRAGEDMAEDVRTLTPVYTGKLRDSIQVRVARDYTLESPRIVVVVFSKLGYAGYVEAGRGRGKVPIDDIADWVRKRLGVSNYEEAQKIAYAVSNKIRHRGTFVFPRKPPHMFARSQRVAERRTEATFYALGNIMGTGPLSAFLGPGSSDYE